MAHVTCSRCTSPALAGGEWCRACWQRWWNALQATARLRHVVERTREAKACGSPECRVCKALGFAA